MTAKKILKNFYEKSICRFGKKSFTECDKIHVLDEYKKLQDYLTADLIMYANFYENSNNDWYLVKLLEQVDEIKSLSEGYDEIITEIEDNM